MLTAKNIVTFFKANGKNIQAVTFDGVSKKVASVLVDGQYYSVLNILPKEKTVATTNGSPTHVGKVVVGALVVDGFANLVGAVDDVGISPKGKLTYLQTNGQRISAGAISSLGDVVLLKKPRSTATAKPLAKKSGNGVKAVPNEVALARLSAKQIKNLVGKVCKKTVCNISGETIVKRGRVITAKAIAQAGLNGKLIELAYYSAE